MKHRKQYPGASPYTDARGKRRWRYRKNGKSFELGTNYGSAEFVQRYEAAVQGAKIKGMIGADRITPGTINDLVARYYVVAFAGDRLSPSTKASYRGIIEKFREAHGHRPVATLKPHIIETLIAQKADTPNAANNFRKRLAQLLDHAVKLEWLTVNPARQTKPLEIAGGGHHTWTEAEISRFYATHKPGTLPHKVMTLMLWTGAARVDVVKLGWFSIKDTENGPRLQYRRQKTRRDKEPVLISLPIAPELDELLKTCPKNEGTFLQTKFGKKRSAKSVTGDMRKWCDEAGLPHCTAHGLRKAIARRLAEAGASAPQIGAITGHKTLSEVQRYIAAANREGMASDGMALLMARPNGEQTVVNLPLMFANRGRNQLK
ncbi:tyrosine-type recombinase/integrase [Pararhodobacter oceanensis]|uniref:tyrosine-type recombinase/integrase n=1 Tax=Pararhodobacter oceanensis TaxID=2172121 RepID=UPI003A8EF3D9